MPLHPKNREALDRLGAKRILAALANVPDLSAEPSMATAKEFLASYGPLRRPPVTAPEENHYVLEIISHAVEFRRAWHARTQAEMDHISIFLDGIFEPNPFATWEGSAIRADFGRRQWEPTPRTLLDSLAIQLMRSRKMLHRCERPECQRYMVKEFSRDRYCSLFCSEDMRSRGQSKWAEDNRKMINRRRRKKGNK